MRVVIDTNVLARAAISETGPAAALLDCFRDPSHEIIISDFLCGELAETLRYPRLRQLHGLTEEEIEDYVSSLRAAAHEVEVPQLPPDPIVLSDPDDDYVIATAIVGQADAICTLDKHFQHPDVRSYCETHGIRIVSDVELLRELRVADLASEAD